MIENSIDILAVTETGHTDSSAVDSMFKSYTFRGNTFHSGAGGVGFIIRNDLLDSTIADIHQGEFANSLFLTLKT